MISVIIPAYNAAGTIKHCLNSLLDQDFADYEIIVIDDGSNDSTGDICKNYMQEQQNIRYIRQENAGPSAARNNGTQNAKGEYITFVDSDDYVGKHYLSKLYSMITSYQGELSALCMKKTSSLEEKETTGNEILVYNSEEALSDMLYQKNLDTSPCGLLIKKDIVLSNPFPVGKLHEDDFTTYKYYLSAHKTIVSQDVCYFYYQRAGSIMHVFGQANMDELDAADNLVTFCEKHYPQLIAAAKSKKFSDYCQVLLSNKDIKTTYPEAYARICDYLDNVKFEIVRDKKCRAKNRIAALLCIINKNLLLAAKKFAEAGTAP